MVFLELKPPWAFIFLRFCKMYDRFHHMKIMIAVTSAQFITDTHIKNVMSKEETVLLF